MSLNWDITKVSPLTPRDGVTDTLIYMTAIVGMGEITKKNAAEFFMRVELMQALNGPMMSRFDEATQEHVGNPITLQHVEAHIGMRTNVVTETWRKFSTRIMTNWHNDRVYRSNNAREAVVR